MRPVIALMGSVASHELMHRTLRELYVSGVLKATTHSGDKGNRNIFYSVNCAICGLVCKLATIFERWILVNKN